MRKQTRDKECRGFYTFFFCLKEYVVIRYVCLLLLFHKHFLNITYFATQQQASINNPRSLANDHAVFSLYKKSCNFFFFRVPVSFDIHDNNEITIAVLSSISLYESIVQRQSSCREKCSNNCAYMQRAVFTCRMTFTLLLSLYVCIYIYIYIYCTLYCKIDLCLVIQIFVPCLPTKISFI